MGTDYGRITKEATLELARKYSPNANGKLGFWVASKYIYDVKKLLDWIYTLEESGFEIWVADKINYEECNDWYYLRLIFGITGKSRYKWYIDFELHPFKIGGKILGAVENGIHCVCDRKGVCGFEVDDDDMSNPNGVMECIARLEEEYLASERAKRKAKKGKK